MPASLREILGTPPPDDGRGEIIGKSREGRELLAFRIGSGARRVSLLGGCHADEPVGPRFLTHLVGWLHSLEGSHPLLAGHTFCIVPHINPDGAVRNATWQDGDADAYDIAAYLRTVTRELPGDDIEFGFPLSDDDTDARPENRAVREWWKHDAAPFVLHASLHGMAVAAGPWFLVEPAWRDRSRDFQNTLTATVESRGYTLHDVERHGEKGFHRIARGFCTRPDSESMRRFFLDQGDETTASLFRPSSMEAIRALGGDPLTLVSEMPLFITPGVGEDLGPPDPVAVQWAERLQAWRVKIAGGPGADEEVRREATKAGLRAMPVEDQMALQWEMIQAGLELIAGR